MSYYYNYYAGYMLNNKIYPWGPYDRNGKLHAILSRSHSYASDLYKYFYTVEENAISDELRKEFEYKNWDGSNVISVKYLQLEKLPTRSFIKKGYFLIKDVEAYESNKEYFEGFCDVLTSDIYAAKLQNELMFGKNQPKKDDEGYEYTEPNASDYMYFAYPDYETKEYESFLIREVFDMLNEYDLPSEAEFVVLETEG